MWNCIKHLFKQRLCINSIYIDESDGGITLALKCRECDREIGFIYPNGVEWGAFIHPKFRRYKRGIERWVREHTKDKNHMGNSYEQEWKVVLQNLKQWSENYVLPVECEKWDRECEEESEDEEPNGIGEEYIIGIDLASGLDVSF